MKPSVLSHIPQDTSNANADVTHNTGRARDGDTVHSTSCDADSNVITVPVREPQVKFTPPFVERVILEESNRLEVIHHVEVRREVGVGEQHLEISETREEMCVKVRERVEEGEGGRVLGGEREESKNVEKEDTNKTREDLSFNYKELMYSDKICTEVYTIWSGGWDGSIVIWV